MLEHGAAVLWAVGNDWSRDPGVWVLGTVAAGSIWCQGWVQGKGARAISRQGQQDSAGWEVCWGNTNRAGVADDLQDALGGVQAAQGLRRTQWVQFLDVHTCKSYVILPPALSGLRILLLRKDEYEGLACGILAG